MRNADVVFEEDQCVLRVRMRDGNFGELHALMVWLCNILAMKIEEGKLP